MSQIFGIGAQLPPPDAPFMTVKIWLFYEKFVVKIISFENLVILNNIVQIFGFNGNIILLILAYFSNKIIFNEIFHINTPYMITCKIYNKSYCKTKSNL